MHGKLPSMEVISKNCLKIYSNAKNSLNNGVWILSPYTLLPSYSLNNHNFLN